MCGEGVEVGVSDDRGQSVDVRLGDGGVMQRLQVGGEGDEWPCTAVCWNMAPDIRCSNLIPGQ